MQKHWPGDSQSDDSVGSFALMHRLKTKPGVDGTQIVHGNLACPYQTKLNCDKENLLRAPRFFQIYSWDFANVG